MREIVLDAPGKNAIGSELLEGLERELAQANGAPVLVTGRGDAFSAGLNLKEVARLDAVGMERFLAKLDRVCSKLFDYPGPTMALVNGHAIAGGCIFALCCDFRVGVASERTRIGLNEVALGLRFPPAVMRIVKARVPARCWAEVVLAAGLYPPERARELGLLDEVRPDLDAAERWARAKLEDLGASLPDAYAIAKSELLRGITEVSEAEKLQFRERDLPVWTGPEIRARIERVLRK